MHGLSCLANTLSYLTYLFIKLDNFEWRPEDTLNFQLSKRIIFMKVISPCEIIFRAINLVHNRLKLVTEWLLFSNEKDFHFKMSPSKLGTSNLGSLAPVALGVGVDVSRVVVSLEAQSRFLMATEH